MASEREFVLIDGKEAGYIYAPDYEAMEKTYQLIRKRLGKPRLKPRWHAMGIKLSHHWDLGYHDSRDEAMRAIKRMYYADWSDV